MSIRRFVRIQHLLDDVCAGQVQPPHVSPQEGDFTHHVDIKFCIPGQSDDTWVCFTVWEKGLSKKKWSEWMRDSDTDPKHHETNIVINRPRDDTDVVNLIAGAVEGSKTDAKQTIDTSSGKSSIRSRIDSIIQSIIKIIGFRPSQIMHSEDADEQSPDKKKPEYVYDLSAEDGATYQIEGNRTIRLGPGQWRFKVGEICSRACTYLYVCQCAYRRGESYWSRERKRIRWKATASQNAKRSKNRGRYGVRKLGASTTVMSWLIAMQKQPAIQTRVDALIFCKERVLLTR